VFPRSRWPDAAAARRFPFERIADFAASACAEHLAGDVRRLFKRNVLDSIGYAIAALPGSPFHALRKQFEEHRAPERRTLIGGGKTSVDQAALFNSGLTRYVDLLDSYMSSAASLIRATISAPSWRRRNMPAPRARTSCSPSP